MDWKIEVIAVPVTDVDRAKRFYAEQCGFVVDVDHQATESMRVVQLTPPGSACSIAIGTGITDAAPGSLRGLQIVVADVELARSDLIARGVDAGPGPPPRERGVARRQGRALELVRAVQRPGRQWLDPAGAARRVLTLRPATRAASRWPGQPAPSAQGISGGGAKVEAIATARPSARIEVEAASRMSTTCAACSPLARCGRPSAIAAAISATPRAQAVPR